MFSAVHATNYPDSGVKSMGRNIFPVSQTNEKSDLFHTLIS